MQLTDKYSPWPSVCNIADEGNTIKQYLIVLNHYNFRYLSITYFLMLILNCFKYLAKMNCTIKIGKHSTRC